MLEELMMRRPELRACEGDIASALDALIKCYEKGGKLLLCGNGGSAADCDHIVGELMKDFLVKRPLSEEKKEEMKARCATLSDSVLDTLQLGLPAISLPSVTGFNTAFCNDRDPELVYAQGVLALAREGDVLLAISTSGNARNVIRAVEVAKGLGVTVIGLSGKSGGTLHELADTCITVPEDETYKIQELHICVYHYLCAALEKHFFGL